MNLLLLIESLQTDWKELLRKYPNWNELNEMFEYEQNKESSLDIFPPINDIFACFRYFNIKDTRVIILGQDPYHGRGQACGMAFAVNNNVRPPPSLKNIFKLIGNPQTTPDLESWAKQGVLLLNTYLTVRESKPGSHRYIWKNFTEWVLTEISKMKLNKVTIIWGAHAYEVAKKSNLLTENDIISSHPSPLSSHKKYKDYPAFVDSNVFERVNAQIDNKIIW